MTRFIVGLIMCVLWVLPVQAATIVSEDFEVTAGNITPSSAAGIALAAREWNTTTSLVPSTGDIVTSPVHSGSKALRYTHSGIHCTATGACDDASNFKISQTFAGVEELYERYWVRYDPIDPGQSSSFVDGHGNSSSKQHYYNPGGVQPFFSIIQYTNLTNNTNSPGFFVGSSGSAYTIQCPSGSSGAACNIPPNMSGMTIPFNQWVCVESHQKLNTPGSNNGVLELWLNGTQTLGYTNVMFRNVGDSTSRFIFLQIYRQGANNLYRYEDDYVLATTRVGCSGSPSADTTRPNPPTGLTVQ